MVQVDILFGGNVGNTPKIFREAKRQLEKEAGAILMESSLYRTEAWGFDSEPFLNQVVSIQTMLPPDELLRTLLAIERVSGRERKGEGYAARTLDLDILFLEDRIINTPDLVVPHPRMGERRFVLVPLNELYPERMHPVTGKTIRQMLTECTDTSAVEKL
jgi:2-amino-4-hydroxy-6-hydroxymethyldihydropteridine diphosphokinase